MNTLRSMLVRAGLALTALTATGWGQSLTTTYADNNAQDGNMFNMIALQVLTVDRFDVHFDNTTNPGVCGTGCAETEVEVYRTDPNGGFGPVSSDPSAWTLIGTVQHTITTGSGVPQPLNLPIGLAMDPNGVKRYGLYVTSTGDFNGQTGNPNEFIRYTNGTGVQYTNGDMTVKEGIGLDYPFGGQFSPRTWNGTVYYTLCQNSVTSYCTAGTSASGCSALLTSSGTPSATAGSGFVVTAAAVEGDANGLYFFGTGGRQATPWGNGTSYRCVAPPTQRGPIQNGGGNPGHCNGTFTQDLNALWASAPNQNPGPAAVVQTQLWYRDPQNTSNQVTSLSDALEFQVCP